jgi:hypothetical protein
LKALPTDLSGFGRQKVQHEPSRIAYLRFRQARGRSLPEAKRHGMKTPMDEMMVSAGAFQGGQRSNSAMVMVALAALR